MIESVVMVIIGLVELFVVLCVILIAFLVALFGDSSEDQRPRRRRRPNQDSQIDNDIADYLIVERFLDDDKS
jgi:hypothetical protein